MDGRGWSLFEHAQPEGWSGHAKDPLHRGGLGLRLRLGEPSVEPLLQMVQSIAGWRYIHRNSATPSEMRYWLKTESCADVCEDCKILYIASHGDPGTISLSNRPEFGDAIGIQALSESIDEGFAKDRLVHFSGCKVLKGLSNDDIKKFLKSTGASAVSGFAKDAGWASANKRAIPPSVALELIYFSSICEQDVKLHHHRSVQVHLPRLATRLRKRFPDCGFRLRSRWDKD